MVCQLQYSSVLGIVSVDQSCRLPLWFFSLVSWMAHRSYSLLVSKSFPWLFGIRHSLKSLLHDLPDNGAVLNN